MLLDFLSWQGIMIAIGEITFILLLGLFIFGLVLVIIIMVSVRRGRFYLPGLIKPGLSIAGSLVRALCKLMGMEEDDLTMFLINMRNKMNREEFASTPVEQRAIFLPQCLRSSKCPSRLGPEGLTCMHCKRCGISAATDHLEKMGYKIFIMPGSTFVKRIVMKYRPRAVLGVGCLMEVREGLELADKLGVPALGLVMLRDGCVETDLNWEELLKMASIGLDVDPVKWSASSIKLPVETG